MSAIETGTDHLLGRVEGHVAVLSFNRPEARNALSDEIYDGFAHALPAIAADSNIRVLMLTGENDAFCAGGDVKGMHARNSGKASGRGSVEDAIARLRHIQNLVSGSMRRLPQPVIAAIPGAAAGAGCVAIAGCHGYRAIRLHTQYTDGQWRTAAGVPAHRRAGHDQSCAAGRQYRGGGACAGGQ